MVSTLSSLLQIARVGPVSLLFFFPEEAGGGGGWVGVWGGGGWTRAGSPWGAGKTLYQ